MATVPIQVNMSWQGFLIEIASSVAANKPTEAMLDEFIRAQQDQLHRIEVINQDMQYGLFRPERGASGPLDERWRAALSHVQRAAASPHRFAEEMAEACEKFGAAYTISRDNLRCSWIAQELAAVYATSGDYGNAKIWLGNGYGSGLKGLKDQTWKAAEIIESETENHARAYKRYLKQRDRVKTRRDLLGLLPGLCRISFRDEITDPGPRPFKKGGWYGALANEMIVHRITQGLDKLFADLAQLRRACLRAGIDESDLPLPYDPHDGGIRVASFVPGADFDTLAYFDSTPPHGPRFSTDTEIDIGIELGPLRYIYIQYS